MSACIPCRCTDCSAHAAVLPEPLQHFLAAIWQLSDPSRICGRSASGALSFARLFQGCFRSLQRVPSLATAGAFARHRGCLCSRFGPCCPLVARASGAFARGTAACKCLRVQQWPVCGPTGNAFPGATATGLGATIPRSLGLTTFADASSSSAAPTSSSTRSG